MIEKKFGFSSFVIKILELLIPVVGVVLIFNDKKDEIGAKIAKCFAYLVFWIFSASIVFVIVWSFLNSAKTDDEFFTNMVAMPIKFSFKNYGEAYKYIEYNGVKFTGMFLNSIWFSVGSSLLTILAHAVTGYVFAKYDFPGKSVAFKFILFTIALPIVGSLPSLYKVVYSLKINDSPALLVRYLGGFSSNFLIMYSFFVGIDKTYMEAAEIDGANRFYVFFKIMLPLALGPCFALFILTFINQWNDYESAILFLDRLPTLSSGLYQFSEYMRFSESSSPNTVYFAGVLLASLPVLVVIICFGDKLTKNVNIGGIKG